MLIRDVTLSFLQRCHGLGASHGVLASDQWHIKGETRRRGYSNEMKRGEGKREREREKKRCRNHTSVWGAGFGGVEQKELSVIEDKGRRRLQRRGRKARQVDEEEKGRQ